MCCSLYSFCFIRSLFVAKHALRTERETGMSHSTSRSNQILGVVLVLVAIAIAVVLYFTIGTRGLLAGVAPAVFLVIWGILLFLGWPRRARK